MAVCLPDLPFATVDVFTQTPFTGNPLAIVRDADGLSSAQMQTIAREFNLSETIFVMAPRNPAHAARVRIFFPTAEIPFAGHPTVGCAIHLALRGQSEVPAEPNSDFDQLIVLEEEAGDVPVQVKRRSGIVSAEFRAPVLPFAVDGAVLPDVELAAGALGLTPQDLGPQPAGVFEGGPRFLYLAIRDLDALARAQTQEPAWSAMMQAAGVDSGWLYTRREDGSLQVRMFSPTDGIPEDPATGSAAALYAAQWAATDGLPDGESHLTVHQGVEMGRPSEILLRVLAKQGKPTAIYVSGCAVPVSTGRIRIPEAD